MGQYSCTTPFLASVIPCPSLPFPLTTILLIRLHPRCLPLHLSPLSLPTPPSSLFPPPLLASALPSGLWWPGLNACCPLVHQPCGHHTAALMPHSPESYQFQELCQVSGVCMVGVVVRSGASLHKESIAGGIVQTY